MKKLSVSWVLLGLIACNSPKSELPECPVADIRAGIENPESLKLDEEIERVDYVPLEVTSDDASLIDGVANYAVTDHYIYVLPVKEQRIVLFDRQGHFVKTLIPFGQGPGEFSGFVASMQADEKNNRLYLFSTDRAEVYTLDGEPVGHWTHDYQIISQYQLKPDCLAAIAMPYVPFRDGSFGIGLFTEKGDTIAMKHDFSSPLVPADKAGLTIRMAAGYSDRLQSVLFKTGSNDTVFRLSGNTISPACVLSLRNSDEEVAHSLDATDFSSLRNLGSGKDYFVSDLFETPRRYYFRLRNNDGHYVASVDKKNGEVLVEKCEQPAPIRDLAATTLQHGLLGTRCYRAFPIWGNRVGDELVQVITPAELDYYKESRSFSMPEQLKGVGEESNPVFVFYKLKNS
ncbi:MAG: 6-bladed beta-propeller [Parabacteroides sp.]|nr:6-bladed beta-propeller [Parabacteroides sp.]